MNKSTVLIGLAILSSFAMTGCSASHRGTGVSQSVSSNATSHPSNSERNPNSSVANRTNSTTVNTSTPPAAVSITSNSPNPTFGPQQLNSTIQHLLTNPKNAPADCSALVQYVYTQAGLTIPRTIKGQATLGARISAVSQLQYGDIVFFDLSSQPNTTTFDGIYIGNGQFVAKTTHGIMSIEMNSKYWASKFLFGQRP